MSDTQTAKKHILMVGPDRSVHGGISAVVNSCYEAGLDSVADPEYIGTMKEGSRPYKLIVAAAAYVRFLCRLKRADIVHVHVASDSSFIRKSFFIKAAKRHNKRILIHQHGGNLENWIKDGGDKRKKTVISILDMADRIITISPAYKDVIAALSDDEGFRRKIIVLPNSIRIPEKMKTGEERNIIYLGRICRDKGIPELIRAMHAVGEVYPDAVLKLAGIWEDEDLKTAAALAGNIEYAGWVQGDAKEELLSSGMLFVLPSLFEGQSVSILEAMASGCLVIASNVGGIPMMVRDNETGLLIEPGNEKMLTETILKALSSDYSEERIRICGNARRLIENEYDIDTYLKTLLQIYDGMSADV